MNCSLLWPPVYKPFWRILPLFYGRVQTAHTVKPEGRYKNLGIWTTTSISLLFTDEILNKLSRQAVVLWLKHMIHLVPVLSWHSSSTPAQTPVAFFFMLFSPNRHVFMTPKLDRWKVQRGFCSLIPLKTWQTLFYSTVSVIMPSVFPLLQFFASLFYLLLLSNTNSTTKFPMESVLFT